MPLFVQPIEAKMFFSISKTNVLECMAAGSPTPKLMAGKTFVVTPLHFFLAGNQMLIIMESQSPKLWQIYVRDVQHIGDSERDNWTENQTSIPDIVNSSGIIKHK